MIKELTQTQLTAIQNLAKNPLTPFVDLWFSQNGLDKILIKSAIDAELGEIESVINSVLGESFPGLEHFGNSSKYFSAIDCLDVELHLLSFEGETLITVMVRTRPNRDWSIEDILRNEG